MNTALIILQSFVVLFIALHDWVPLGRLNDIKAVHAADPPGKLIALTVLSTLPFAFRLVESIRFANAHFPFWLMVWLWGSYGVATYGMLATWWIPYLLVPNPARTARAQAMFANTHSFLPLRHGMRPNTLHIVLHVVIVSILILLVKKS
jgi:hypothetical protein